jgi:hypothetical protein
MGTRQSLCHVARQFHAVAADAFIGQRIMKRVPLPGVLSTSILPLCVLTIQATKLRPSPRPCSGVGAVPWPGSALQAGGDGRCEPQTNWGSGMSTDASRITYTDA